MIVFDCEKMIYPNTGLNSFCDNLGRALLKEMDNRRDISFFVRKQQNGYFGDDCRYIDYKSFYRFAGIPSRICRNVAVWHSTFQFPKVLPDKVPVILTVHDLNFLYTDDRAEQKKRQRRLQKVIDKASAVVAISEYTKKDILKFMEIKGKPLHVIYNGCNVYSGKIEVPEFRPEHEFLFSVGTLFPKKNFHVLPWLLQGNSYELIIAGTKMPYENRIMQEASEAGVLDRVHLVGPIDESSKQWYLENCSAFVFPSLAEGFGLPVLEAMYYGKPVFLSTHTSLPEIGRDKAFYFDPEFSHDAMQKEFLEGMEKYRSGKLSPDAIRKHAESFSWQAAAKAYCKLYTDFSKTVAECCQ